MVLRPPRSTRTDTTFPDTTLVRSRESGTAQGSAAVEEASCGVDAGGETVSATFSTVSAVSSACCAATCALPPANNPESIVTSCIHRSEAHTSELQSLMRISYAVFCLTNKKTD